MHLISVFSPRIKGARGARGIGYFLLAIGLLALIPQKIRGAEVNPVENFNQIRPNQLNVLQKVDPAQVSKNIRNGLRSPALRPRPSDPPLPSFQPPPPPEKRVRKGPFFTLNKVILTGCSLYSEAELGTLYGDYLGKSVCFADLQELTQKILEKYRKDGYFFVKILIPEQTVQEGKVTLHAMESFIHKVTFSGATPTCKPFFDAYAQRLVTGKTFSYKEVQEVLFLANALPGIKVNGVLAADPEMPRGLNFKMNVVEKKRQSFIHFNNHNGKALGPNQAVVGNTFNNLMVDGDQLSTVYAMNPDYEKRMRYGSLSYTRFFYDGSSLEAAWNCSHTRPGLLFEVFDFRGQNQNFLLTWRRPLEKTFEKNTSWMVKLDGSNSWTYVNALKLLDSHNRIRSVRLGYNYNYQTEGRVTTGQLIFSQGLNVMDAHKAFSQISQSMRPGKLRYTKVESEWSQTYTGTSPFSFKWGNRVQYSLHSLLPSEKLSFGGSDYGRGYDNSEVLGDYGFAAYGELRLDTHPQGDYIQTLQYYTFYDYGALWNRDAIGKGRLSAASAGFGARIYTHPLAGGSRLVLQGEWTHALTRPIASTGNKKPRFYLTGTYIF